MFLWCKMLWRTSVRRKKDAIKTKAGNIQKPA
jgi:hypothetical protein